MALTDKLSAIGDSIRAKTGKAETMTLDQMPTEIASIVTGGIGGKFSSLVDKSITELVAEDLEGVTTIGQYAFYGCNSLQKITIPEGITALGKYAFYGCRGVIEINYNAINAKNLSTTNYVFSYVGSNASGITVNIGKNVSQIPEFLFCPETSSDRRPNIVSVNFLGNSQCSQIGNYSFRYCNALGSINLPSSITKIGDYAFYYCTSLTSVKMNSITPPTLASNSFLYCTALEKIIVPIGCGDAYKSATNWSAYADIIFEEGPV